jgi:hypothetical protein
MVVVVQEVLPEWREVKVYMIMGLLEVKDLQIIMEPVVAELAELEVVGRVA